MRRGMDLKAIQELLGHEWLSTTTRYIHVHADHIEQAWADANERVATSPACTRRRGEPMRWNLRMKAAERGIWKSTEMRRRLAEAGLEISAGKMSALWTGTPTTIRLDDLDVICAVLDCEPAELLIREPGRGRRPPAAASGQRQRRARHDPDRPARGSAATAPARRRDPARPLPTGTNTPRACVACHQRVAAWTTPRVDYCYDCMPGGPFAPPPCLTLRRIRTPPLQLLQPRTVQRCHAAAPQRVDACRDCLAWGVIRRHKWLCWRCDSWRTRYARGTCAICGRDRPAEQP